VIVHHPAWLHSNHDFGLTLENKPPYNAPAAAHPACPPTKGSLGNPTRSTTLLRLWRLKPLAAAIVAAGALGSGDDRAATLDVATLAENSGTACTLRDAVNSVNAQADQGQCVASGAYGAGDTVRFAPGLTGTIAFFNRDPLSSPGDGSALVIRQPVAILGPGSSALALTCGSTSYRMIEVDAGVTAASVSGVTLANCVAPGSGAGIRADVRLSNVALSLRLTDVTLSTNRATGQGGGLAIFAGAPGATVTLTACNIQANRATTLGGGIAVSDASGGSGTDVSVTDSLVTQNTATQSGGGALAFGGSAQISFTRTTIDRNSASSGGGIEIEAAEVAVLDSTLSGNQVAGAAAGGGGVRMFGSGTRFDAVNSTLSANSATGRGGGIYALRIGSTGVLSLADTTIANNKTSLGGGVMLENTYSGSLITPANVVNIVDTIVAGNVASSDIASSEPQIMGGVLPWNVSYSVIGASGAVTLIGTGNIVDGAVPPPFGVTPWLAPLQNNGGPTLTHALLANVPDPALDSGDPTFSGLAYDQRGKPFKRVQNGRVDIGAYEFRLAPTSGAGGIPVPGPRGWALSALSALLGWLGWRLRPRR
jgi:hypothetical protein